MMADEFNFLRPGIKNYHCHHKHYRPEKNLSELFPAILDRIITGEYSRWINSIVIRAHYRKHLAVHWSDDTRMEILWTKSCNELPDENSPIINFVIFDRNITGQNFQRINLVMILVAIVQSRGRCRFNSYLSQLELHCRCRCGVSLSTCFFCSICCRSNSGDGKIGVTLQMQRQIQFPKN